MPKQMRKRMPVKKSYEIIEVKESGDDVVFEDNFLDSVEESKELGTLETSDVAFGVKVGKTPKESAENLREAILQKGEVLPEPENVEIWDGPIPERELLDMDAEIEPEFIEAKLALEKIVMEKMKWTIKIKVDSLLDYTLRKYHMILELDEEPYLTRMQEIQDQYQGSLFEDDTVIARSTLKKISQMQKELNELKELCEKIDFSSAVQEVKHQDGGTMMVMQVPDDVIEQFNRQKIRLNLYKVKLQAL